ncbi:hypothetical protein QN416_23120 [Glaciimonas sp. Cout2]|uniref:hypothetical protein n=1 Tax=Glaciimonas sp. Cout2 TaxID=3048621 RepID=UPI002B23A845|nr:hypothetical protein [Glaciimonas sp. Cout2]MEB0014493.1 hypothetical protein [Glaciimonas sp. Cout2]
MTTLIKLLNNPYLIGLLLFFFGFVDLLLLGIAGSFSKSDMASWAQAIGAFVAIYFAGSNASKQAARQYADAAKLQKMQGKDFEVRMAQAVEIIAENVGKRAMLVIRTFEWDLQTFSKYADGDIYFDGNLLVQMQNDLDTIPLHDLPNSTVIHEVMALRSVVRQFRENIERAIAGHRQADAIHFMNFFSMLDNAHMQMSVAVVKIGREVATIKHRL